MRLAESDWVTTAIAVWGAITGSLSLGWSIFRDIRNAGRVKVVVGTSAHMEGGRTRTEGLLVDITNTGHQSIVIVSVHISPTRRSLPFRQSPWLQVAHRLAIKSTSDA